MRIIQLYVCFTPLASSLLTATTRIFLEKFSIEASKSLVPHCLNIFPTTTLKLFSTVISLRNDNGSSSRCILMSFKNLFTKKSIAVNESLGAIPEADSFNDGSFFT